MKPHTNFPKIRALILDMDGVLWRGNSSIGNLQSIFDKISKLGLDYAFATNNSTSSTNQYVNKFHHHGLEIPANKIVTSGFAVAELLKKQFPFGGPVYIIGEEGLFTTLEDFGFYPAEENVIAVVVGLDRNFTYQKIRHASLLIRNNIPFFGTNPDATYPAPEGLVPGAGAVIGAIEISTNTKPIIAGKPFPFIMKTAMEQLQREPHECLVVGDRLDTDIQGGKNSGCPTALVLSGVTSKIDADHSNIKPDIIANDLESLLEILS